MPKYNYIYKRSGSKFWQFTFTHKGKRYKGTTYLSNQARAAEWAAKKRTQIINEEVGLVEFVPPPTLREFAPVYLEINELRHSEKPRTITFYQQKLRQLLRFQPLSSARLDRVDEALIDRYKAKRKAEVSTSSCNRELATLSVILNIAYERKLISRIPKIRRFREKPGRKAVLLDCLEAAFVGSCEQPLRDLVVLILDTGLRSGEALNLRWADVELNTGEPRLHVRDGKSRDSVRTVELTSRAALVLSTRMLHTGPEWVFPGRSLDKPLLVTSASHMFRKTCAQFVDEDGEPMLPREFVLHSLRHTFLTRVSETGANPFEIMKLAGHASITTSQRYVHTSVQSVRRTIARLEDRNRAHEMSSFEGRSPHFLPQPLAEAA